ncbi:hypothetical protein PLICRDRAFT_56407 [Plicaturopsis crispa FD-325 SS-3]|nr:hypothetical protein PLICRDRAFT_56407 [Plicaturopsis crispa FD-325 SS-3]
MGRPLFSKTCKPAPRAEPEPTPAATAVSYKKWTPWDAFDPDSDEFFQSPEAVYEAFLSPAEVAASRSQVSNRALTDAMTAVIGPSGLMDLRAPHPLEGRDRERVVPDIRDGLDGRSFEDVSDAELVRSYRPVLGGDGNIHYGTAPPMESAQSPAIRPEVPASEYTLMGDIVFRAREVDRRASRRRANSATIQPRSGAPTSSLRNTTVVDPRAYPQTSDITPIDLDMPGYHREIDASAPAWVHRPSTPPRQMREAAATPSPAPTVTPRFYSWASTRMPTTIPVSPIAANGPLTNPNARMSLAHIAPTTPLTT